MKLRNKNDDTTTDHDSPYLKAQEEWATRIGNAKSQLLNWQIIALGSVIISVLLLIAIVIISGKQKEYVYVAEVGPNQSVVNTVSIDQKITASQAQKAYFVSEFINEIMSLPLDPVVARNNWFSAYQKVTGTAVGQLTTFAQASNPFDNLGTMTSAVQINSFNAQSDNSIQVTWTQTTYDNQGQVNKKAMYSGLFTLQQGPTPTDVKSVLQNPFGLKITYFSLNNEAQQ